MSYELWAYETGNAIGALRNVWGNAQQRVERPSSGEVEDDRECRGDRSRTKRFPVGDGVLLGDAQSLCLVVGVVRHPRETRVDGRP